MTAEITKRGDGVARIEGMDQEDWEAAAIGFGQQGKQAQADRCQANVELLRSMKGATDDR